MCFCVWAWEVGRERGVGHDDDDDGCYCWQRIHCVVCYCFSFSVEYENLLSPGFGWGRESVGVSPSHPPLKSQHVANEVENELGGGGGGV